MLWIDAFIDFSLGFMSRLWKEIHQVAAKQMLKGIENRHMKIAHVKIWIQTDTKKKKWVK